MRLSVAYLVLYEMVCLSVVLLFLFSSVVLSEDSLLTPCDIQDIECLSKATQEFLDKTSNGLPQHDIRQIDPMFIPSMEIMLQNPNIKLILQNTTVKGLKNQKLVDFKFNTDTKSVSLQTKMDVDVSSDLLIKLENGKEFSGGCEIKGKALGTANYNYDFKKDDKDVEHFEIGPETSSCQVLGDVQFNLTPQFQELLFKDKDIKNLKEKHSPKSSELKKKVLCTIIKTTYVSIVHNIRAAAHILPKNAFLKNV